MAVFVEYCLFCDICNENWDEAEPDDKPQKRRRLAKQDGWTVRKIKGENRDLCPECEMRYQNREDLIPWLLE